jgi:hypothetical protein
MPRRKTDRPTCPVRVDGGRRCDLPAHFPGDPRRLCWQHVHAWLDQQAERHGHYWD